MANKQIERLLITTALDSGRNWASVIAPYIDNNTFIDNVLSIQNKSIGNAGQWRGNAAINFLDSAGTERAAVGYSRNPALAPDGGYLPKSLYLEVGNPFTTDAQVTDFRIRSTIMAGGPFFSGVKVEYDAMFLNTGTGEISFNGWVAGAQSRLVTMTGETNPRVLVGQSAAGAGADGKLSVTGDIDGRSAFTAKGAVTTPGDSIPVGIIYNPNTSGNNEFLHFSTETSYTKRGSITYNRGSAVVAYNTTSDYRAKDVLGPIENALDILMKLKPVKGRMHGASEDMDFLVAHELAEVIPYAVTGEKDAMSKALVGYDDNDNPIFEESPEFQQVDLTKTIPILIAAIQELREKVEAYEPR